MILFPHYRIVNLVGMYRTPGFKKILKTGYKINKPTLEGGENPSGVLANQNISLHNIDVIQSGKDPSGLER